ncbi:M23 family metallopeptidase [Ilumatobacter nonamiensis]|uniref:M23 family metallopeptidase n=1 Tax=Ilumatobacter nonamiensis TaxID=467093 RepID=UPI00034C7F1A|nr:peptidoglycan DD-metalloendopeptidase family protein [Ilumatobacter nonamiensis]
MLEPDGQLVPTRARRRRLGAVVLVALTAAGVLPSAASAQSETPAEQAAREIQEARDQANAAADAFFEAESTLDGLEIDLEDLQEEESELQEDVDALQSDVEALALERFVSSGTTGIPLLTGVSGPQDQIQAQVFTDILTNTGADTLDEYDAAATALGEKQDEVADRQAEVEAQREEHERLEEAALAEVERLQEVEAQRLEDEAVRRALEAQLAEQLAAEAAEQEAIAAQQQAEAEAEAAAAQAAPDPAATAAATTAGGSDETDSTTAPASENAQDSAATPSAPETAPAPAPAPEPEPAPAPPSGGGLACPMPGSAYSDTWGAPRSGGRSHEGVDLIAPHGLPIYAVTSGHATFKSTSLGGNSVSLVGDNGNRYFYAHLSGYEGSSRNVSKGELIGYNGATGNANGTNHLHFQVHPGGGQAVNPYPTVRAAGC